MKRMLTVGLIALLAAGALAQDAPATLDGALKALEKLLTRHGSHASAGRIMSFEAKDFRGCRIVYQLTPQLAPDQQGPAPAAERVTINLSLLDPASVKVRAVGGGASVSFSGLGDAKAIERRLGEAPHHFGRSYAHRSSTLFLTDEAAAEEVRAALARAVGLCRP